MALYLITYDLKAATDERQERISNRVGELVADVANVWHHKLQFNSVWWVASDKTVSEVNSAIKGAFHDDDAWYVVDVSGREAQGRSAGDLWGWLTEHGGL